MFSVDEQLTQVARMVESCAIDIRDQWPTSADSYTKSESISRGSFGIVRFADVSDPTFLLDGLETRSCVVKTLYLRRRFDAILREEAAQNQGKAQEMTTTTASKLFRLHRRTLMELYVLSRCRHANLMHLHAVFITERSDMHIVLPRLYVLQQLIQMYKRRKQAEPIPIAIIAKILRQLCLGLDFLQRAGIAHRDVQPENIFLTRNGTPKLGHFAQARAVFGGHGEAIEDCRTPVGREEFMCFEKQHNLYSNAAGDEPAAAAAELLDYSFPADMWSLGVLMLSMVSYFPDEASQKLNKNFALAMHEERMPFIWLTVDMLQLRSRLVKSGGEELKLFLSDQLLTVHAEQRATAASLPNQPEMRRWCLKTVAEDSAYLRRHLINEVDFANQLKLETDAPNYDSLETKDIPAEFYWDDTWQRLERAELCVQLGLDGQLQGKKYFFKFADPEPLFRLIYGEVLAERLELFDLLAVDENVKLAIYEFIRQEGKEPMAIKRQIRLPMTTTRVALARGKTGDGQQLLEVEVSSKQQHLAQHRRLRKLTSESP